VCNKEGCWSSNHSKEEREESRKKFKAKFNQRFNQYARQYIADYEGTDNEDEDDLSSIDEAIEALIVTDTLPNEDNSEPVEHFITSFGALEPQRAFDITTNLANQSLTHALTGADTTSDSTATDSTATDSDPFIYTTTSRYTSDVFYGVMIDTGASRKSTAGYGQYLAYKKVHDTAINTMTAGAINVQFGIGSTPSIGSIIVNTPVGQAEFHIVKADTPFLLCLKDMDTLGVYYNNLKDLLVAPSRTIPVVRRFGHPFMLWDQALYTYICESFEHNPCYLTTTELRQLHRRFGHPSADRLYKVLEHSGHDNIDKKALHQLNKFCAHCQKHGKSPGRFKFTLRDNEDVDFNHSIYVDIMYIDGQPVLHIIDEATRFQAARWLKDISAKHTWDILRLCWIDTYIGPPELITHDAGKNFISREFRQYAQSMAISTKSVPVEAHWSIGLVERAHPILRRAYQIITEECPGIAKDTALQMAVKAINDTAGPNGLVPTLLVFGAYPRMSNLDPPAPSITERAVAIHKAMDEITKIRAQMQVKEGLGQRNGPDTSAIHDAPLNSDVLVWREGNTGQSGKWTGPFKLLGIDRETCRVQLPRGPAEFRTTVVKPFLQEQSDSGPGPEQANESPQTEPEVRPQRAKRLPARFRQNITDAADIMIFIQDKELTADQSPQSPFTASRHKELNGLLENGVFEVVDIKDVPDGTRIFNSRFVDEIKNPGTDKAFEKSRLVIQAYKDTEKDTVLTQSPTIQRASQRLILSLAAVLPDTTLYLRDITQAYTQSKTQLNRNFFVRPPAELKLKDRSILRVVKPLYGVPEAGNHWFNTYHSHHITKLRMNQSTYDPCLLYTTGSTASKTTSSGDNGEDTGFGIIGIQTDDTLILADKTFATNEADELKKAQFLSKERECLTQSNPVKFNGGNIKLENDNSIVLTQECQCKSLRLVTTHTADLTSAKGAVRKAVTPKDQYVAQRARGAYIATVSQPEAAFDLSFAAQVINPKEEHAKQLNKRLQWQIDHPTRGLRFVQLNIQSLKLMVYTDASFANNQDLSSQIGFVIVLSDGNKANILHWSSIKCKRVTRSVLASELYAMAHGFDAGAVVKSTIEAILQIRLPLILCTDSKSLYDCLVKLGTTQEKRLMVDLMCLRQSYERREIAEVRWIDGNNNPADAMTKAKPCAALKDLIDTNTVNIQATQWVERAE
jgi:hypothetical protein